MTHTPLNDYQDAKLDPRLEYRALVRSLKYTQGFGLLFVQCSPAEGERLITKVQQDLPQKHIEVLSLTEPIETLYDKVDDIHRNKPIDILFVKGIEHSLYDYEKSRLWDDEAQRLGYSETGVPRLLQHLNLSRERFQESFAFHFVFLAPHFVLKYLIRRAPDFFDWHSGVFEFAMDREQLRQESQWARIERFSKDNPQNLTPEECRRSLLRIQSLLEEIHQFEEDQLDLLFEQARLFDIAGEQEAAIVSYDKALQFKPNYDLAWNNRGNALGYLGRNEEAIASYEKALQFKSDYDLAWYNRGVVLGNLGRYEEEIASYDKALQINPDDDSIWNNRGIALSNLGRYEEAITSYDEALQIKPDYDSAWYNRGVALGNLGRYEEAIASYNKALQINPDDDSASWVRGYALDKLGRHEEAIASYDKALTINPTDPKIFYNKACCYALQANPEAAIENLSRAIALNPDKYRDMAKTDSDFASIRENEHFKALVAG